MSGQIDNDDPLHEEIVARRFMRERARQRDELGFTAQHDDGHSDGAIARAAAAYALAYAAQLDPLEYNNHQLMAYAREVWPWAPEDFKPRKHGVMNATKAGGLLIAECQRRMRKAIKDVTEMESQ